MPIAAQKGEQAPRVGRTEVCSGRTAFRSGPVVKQLVTTGALASALPPPRTVIAVSTPALDTVGEPPACRLSSRLVAAAFSSNWACAAGAQSSAAKAAIKVRTRRFITGGKVGWVRGDPSNGRGPWPERSRETTAWPPSPPPCGSRRAERARFLGRRHSLAARSGKNGAYFAACSVFSETVSVAAACAIRRSRAIRRVSRLASLAASSRRRVEFSVRKDWISVSKA